MGWIYTQFSVPNGTAGGELQLPYRIRVPAVVINVRAVTSRHRHEEDT